MHILFVHRNFPAQFGQIAAHLVKEQGYRCTFVSEKEPGVSQGVEKIQYRVAGGATRQSHYFSRTFENAIWHAAGVYEALKPHQHTLMPDLIVGHSGFGSTLFLPDLFPDAPLINYFEYYYHPYNSDIDFRPEWPPLEYDRLRARARNAMILLDLENCQAGYSPTHYQKQLFPAVYQPKLEVIHDGIDTTFWYRLTPLPQVMNDTGLPDDVRVVTYVSRGLESLRGFDIFMQIARQIYLADRRVIFLVAGSEKVAYGGDLKRVTAPSFKEHVIQSGDYDLRHFRFLGTIPPRELRALFSISDLHIYLTAPFVLSWSLLNAMACECTILASATAPVQEVIQDGVNGMLCDFFAVESFAQAALQVLRDPDTYRETYGRAARRCVEINYSLDVTLPRFVDFCNRIASA